MLYTTASHCSFLQLQDKTLKSTSAGGKKEKEKEKTPAG